MQPLILTLALDDQSQHFFDEQREKYFPSERNFLKAHLSLFHQLPANESDVVAVIEKACSIYSNLPLHINEVRNIGAGVAYKVDSPLLMQLHAHLQQQWKQWLIPQDQHKLWPHITIQNKVDPKVATTLRDELAQQFEQFTAYGIGFILWEYLGGPWKLRQQFNFNG